MTELSIFEIAGRQARWLMARQAAVAGNVAHASSPGYRAVDVKPFELALEATNVRLSATDGRHFQENAGGGAFRATAMKADETSHSGNTVSLDRQLLIAGEIRQAYSLNAGIVKSMHRMIMSAAKA